MAENYENEHQQDNQVGMQSADAQEGDSLSVPEEEKMPTLEGDEVLTQPKVEPPSSTRRKKKEKKPRSSEWGAGLCLAILSLVVGGMVLLLIMQTPNDLFAPQREPVPTMIPGLQEDAFDDLQMETMAVCPTGDGTVLTLIPQSEGMMSPFQEVYRAVNPAVVTIQAGNVLGGSEGTGVIMSSDGYIITNQHVIDGCSWAGVMLENGDYYEATLVGADQATDLAVLKIQGENDFPVATFGNSDEMVVGDMVLAIGNPLGSELPGTMTDGIISAINRSVDVDGYSMTLLQTSAALNTGNSGGALVNMYGQVIGITNMKMIAKTEDDNVLEGLGFAIPTVTVKTVVDQLIDQGKVTGRPTLGVTVMALFEEDKTVNEVEQGLWVWEVEPNTPANDLLEVNDILVTADGVPLEIIDDLLTLKNTKSAGDTITFEVKRGEEWLTVEVELVEQYVLWE